VKNVKAKKHFGQHFLIDKSVASIIVDSLTKDVDHVVELGPGMGILTEFLLKKDYNCSFVEIDNESVEYLREKFPAISEKIINKDFLKVDIGLEFKGKISIIGNFPYNISSQILFKMLDYKNQVAELVGMFQKEVAERVISNPGSRVYGIISVFVQAYYTTEKLISLGPELFSPPPKVNSTVIRLVRNNVDKLNCNEKLFKNIVKHTFNQRRKMIRNGLKSIGNIDGFDSEYLTMRPEQLGVADFVKLTNQMEEFLK
jgi:16S rRNA (adenine1518-N6/adenine1519-N6)-dimethyltransferase